MFAHIASSLPAQWPEREKTILENSNYLLDHFEAIHIYNTDPEARKGGATEPHVSHVLSSRLSSRPMGWSPKTLKSSCRSWRQDNAPSNRRRHRLGQRLRQRECKKSCCSNSDRKFFGFAASGYGGIYVRKIRKGHTDVPTAEQSEQIKSGVSRFAIHTGSCAANLSCKKTYNLTPSIFGDLTPSIFGDILTTANISSIIKLF